MSIPPTSPQEVVPQQDPLAGVEVFLEQDTENEGVFEKITLHRLPFRIGRSAASELVLFSRSVSHDHAEIYLAHDKYFIRDLASTNGTYVNGKKIDDAPLHHGDIVHIATKEFRFSNVVPQAADRDECVTNTRPFRNKEDAPLSFITIKKLMQEVLREEWVRTVVQPIMDLRTREVVGYEALGRGMHDALTAKPADLLRMAEKVGLAADLSRLFRKVAIQKLLQMSGKLSLFVNVHPLELDDALLVESLKGLVGRYDARHRLVLEVPEDLAANCSKLHDLRSFTRDHDIRLAFDDFGAGQSRLAELVDSPPDFVKLDMRLVRDIHKCQGRQALVRALTKVIDGLKITIVAEGIETREEADVCRELGCHLGQGYLFGRPTSIARFLPPPRDTLDMELGLWGK